MSASVAIVLVNWNSYSFTNDCIQSLYQISYPNFHIIVTDNGSTDGSGLQLAENHPAITVLYNATNTGFTGGNNTGLQYAIDKGFEYIMMLNNDTFVEPHFLEPLVAYMDANPNTGIIQPRIHFNHNRNLLWDGGSYFSKWLGYAYTKGYNQTVSEEFLTIKEVDWITGCGFLTRNKVLQASGLLIEKMFIYSEDVDLSFRIKALGYQLIYHPDSVIYHIAGMSNKSKEKGKEGYVNPIVHYLNIRNKIWLLKKHTSWHHAPTVILFNAGYNLALMGYFIVRGRFAKLKTAFKAIKDGFADHI